MENSNSSHNNLLEELYSSIKDYLNMRIDEAKLSLTESLATLFSKIVVFILIIVTGAVAFGFLAAAFSSWIGSLLGSPTYGQLITGGILLIAVFVLYLLRKKLFADGMVRMIIDMLFKNNNHGK